MPFSLIAYSAVTLAVAGGVAELTEKLNMNIIDAMTTEPTGEEAFLKAVKKSRTPSTHAAYRFALKRFYEIVGQNAELTSENYIKFLQGISDLLPSSQRLYRTAVRRFYDFCEAADARALKRADDFYAQKGGLRIPNPDIDAIDQLIDYCVNLRGDLGALRDRAFVLMAVDTGLRISESLALKRGDIDWKRQRVVVIGKKDKQALVRLSDRSVQALKDYLSARAKLDGASGKPLASLPLFARHDRAAKNRVLPIKKNGMEFSIKGQVKKDGTVIVPGRLREAGVDPSTVRIHDLRHYFVTRIVVTSGNLKTAQVLARHESMNTTQRYTHLNDAELDEDYDMIFNQHRRSPAAERTEK